MKRKLPLRNGILLFLGATVLLFMILRSNNLDKPKEGELIQVREEPVPNMETVNNNLEAYERFLAQQYGLCSRTNDVKERNLLLDKYWRAAFFDYNTPMRRLHLVAQCRALGGMPIATMEDKKIIPDISLFFDHEILQYFSETDDWDSIESLAYAMTIHGRKSESVVMSAKADRVKDSKTRTILMFDLGFLDSRLNHTPDPVTSRQPYLHY